jgi:uncharacterized protein YuzE
MPTKLLQALPDLVADMESPLAHLGRGDLVAQLKAATLESWSYDDFADATYLVLLPSAKAAERLSLYDELGVSLDTDVEGRLCGIEVLDGKRVAELLKS